MTNKFLIKEIQLTPCRSAQLSGTYKKRHLAVFIYYASFNPFIKKARLRIFNNEI
jgi:hypothetical protein